MKRLLSVLLVTIVSGLLLATQALAEPKEIKLTIASSHPLAVPWVGFIKSVFMAAVDRDLAKTGNYKIAWQEAFGGQLYKANATLTSVQQGVTDLGWVFSYLEAPKMPLSQVSMYTPFSTNHAPRLLSTMSELLETVPEFRKEWEQYNLVVLGLTVGDSYDLYMKEEVKSLSQLKGKKISAPGAMGIWLSGTGATPVDGALTTFYTDIQTGVTDGVLSLALGVLPAKLYEVAPRVTRVDMGVVFSGALAANKDSWNRLPKEVQDVMRAAGSEYSSKHGEDMITRHEWALERMVELGKTQGTPVTISKFAQAERRKWVEGMPNIAADWAKSNEGRGLPARKFLKTYLDGLRKRGEKPERDWTQGS